jgi:hypothetical protein
LNAVSRVSSLSLALPVSIVSFSSSRSFSFLPFLALVGLSLSLSFSRFCPVPRSTLATLLFRDLVSAAAFLFFPPFRPICSLLPSFLSLPALLPRRPCFAALYARAFPASPALRSDRLRIHCEIDRPKRVPEWPERTRMQQKGMGWHMRSGRFKGTPQERDATARRGAARRGAARWLPVA